MQKMPLNVLYKELVELQLYSEAELNRMGLYIHNNYIDDRIYYRIKKEVKRLADEALFNKNIKLAKKYFDLCCNMSSCNCIMNHNYFYTLIIEKDYSKAAEILSSLLRGTNIYYQTDYRYYAILLSYLTDLPKDLQYLVLNVTLDDIRFIKGDRRIDPEDYFSYDLLRRSVFFADFKVALSVIEDNLGANNQMDDQIQKTLIKDAAKVEKDNAQTIYQLAKEQKYPEIIEYISNLEKKQKISLPKVYILLLCTEIENMLSSGNVPEIKVEDTDKLSDAIKGHNYELALKLYQNFGQRTKAYNKCPIIPELINRAIKIKAELLCAKNKQSKAPIKTKLVNDEPIKLDSWSTAQEYVNLKYEIEHYFAKNLVNNALITIPVSSNATKENIVNICCYNNLKCFVIGDKSQSIVIHRKNITDETAESLLSKATVAENNKFYSDALEYYYQAMTVGEPNYKIYFKIASILIQLGDNYTGQKYLCVAEELSKIQKAPIYFANNIREIRKQIVNKYEDLEASMKIAYYNDDYIGSVYLIIKTVLESMKLGIDYDAVCYNCNLNDETKVVLAIILARNCYGKGNIVLGDYFFSYAFKSQNKNELASELLAHLTKYKPEIINRGLNGKIPQRKLRFIS